MPLADAVDKQHERHEQRLRIPAKQRRKHDDRRSDRKKYQFKADERAYQRQARICKGENIAVKKISQRFERFFFAQSRCFLFQHSRFLHSRQKTETREIPSYFIPAAASASCFR